MGHFLKNAVVLIGILIISAGIFFLTSENQELRGDVLDRSLKALGNQLISMIPKDNEQDRLKGKWAAFADMASKGELPQEKVERVAVGILNASNNGGKLSAEDAEVMLNLAMNDGESDDTTWAWEESAWVERVPKVAQAKKISVKHGRRTWTEFGKELAAACEFNERIKETSDDEQKRKILVKHLRYDYDDGIKIRADMEIKDALEKAEFAALDKQFSWLENQDMVNWSHNLTMQLDRERFNLKLQLDSLKLVVGSGDLRLDDQFYYIFGHKKEMDALKTLEKLHQLEAINPEYIKKIVIENLSRLDIRIERK